MVYGEPYEGDVGIEVFPGSVRSKMFTIKHDKKTRKLTRVRAWEFEFRIWGMKSSFAPPTTLASA